MKQPVWILNSSLLVLFFMSQILLFMLQKAVPRRISISPGSIQLEEEKIAAPIDIITIYEQDLFGTYNPPILPIESVVNTTVEPIPLPPKFIMPDVPIEKLPTFFAPLDVVLKGVVFVKDDPASCIAIVQSKKTKDERNYQVGDFIEDAQILKILSNRIIIIRSNGQQETLYLREEDAVFDFNTQAKSEPKMIVEDSLYNKYVINIDEFIKRIHNLGEFINLLDLTTVYKQGKSFGCRVGKIEKDSLGSVLGFQTDDIIVKIDDYYIDDLANRMKAYDHIVQKNAGDTIEVLVYRNDDMFVLAYALLDHALKSSAFTPTQIQNKLMEELSRQQAERLQEISEKIIINDNENKENIGLDTNQRSPQVQENSMYDVDKKEVIIHKTMKEQVEGKNKAVIVQSLNSPRLNEAELHTMRLIEEQNKLSSTVASMRSKDKENMMKRTSKNVILHGI